MDLLGVTVFITGAGRRIGAYCAQALALEGARIIIHYHRSKEQAVSLTHTIRERGGTAEVVSGDLADPQQVKNLLSQAESLLGPVRILINNASLFFPGTLTNTPLDQWNQHLGVNLTAPFLLTQAFANQLKPSLSGKVINIIDQRVTRPRSGHLAYTVAKSALWTLTQITAQELAPTIQVNAIAPGPILPALGADPKTFHQVAHATPLKRAGTPKDISNTVLFLIQQDYITGEMICVDGGEHL